ncbi:MAG TPA: ABC transporter ATP-binding protein [Microlunatus sp.]
MIALVGVNGAGKTTTINAILGLLDHDAGRVKIDGVDLDSLPRPQRLGYFGLLSQEFGRYEFTVRDTVRLGRPDGAATDEEIWRALDAAHSGDIVRGMKDGLDAQLSSSAAPACPADNGSDSHWRASTCVTRPSGSWTSQPRRSMPRPRSRSSPSCNAPRRIGSRSWFRTGPGH